MSLVLKSKTLSLSIACPPNRVYDFVSTPENLPKWATAFCRWVRKSGDDWIVDTPDGPMTIKFVASNPFGVLDHDVQPTPDVTIRNPMRVVPNGGGSEVLFTLFQLTTMSDEQFAADAAMVERDLRTLKSVLEA